MLQRALMEHVNVSDSFVSKVSDNDADVMKYAFWMSKTETVDRSNMFASVKERYPNRFMELCQLHLSTIVEIPTDYFDQIHEANFPPPLPILQTYGMTTNVNANTNNKWNGFNSLLKAHFNSSDSIKIKASKTPGEILKPYVEPLLRIMEYIDQPENLSQEGIFRKTGSVVRQREMKSVILDHIHSKRAISISDLNVGMKKTRATTRLEQKVNVHDMCSVLKCLLNELPGPLLTESMLPIFNQVALLSVGRTNDSGYRVPLRPAEEILAIAKQLKAIRILFLYLPHSNVTLLKRLFRLLSNVLSLTKQNLMSAESLGTLFGLLLFAPGSTSNRQLQTVYPNFSRLATIMIKQGVDGLFTLPLSLSNDLQANCFNLTRGYPIDRFDSVDSGLESCETTGSQSHSIPSDSDSNFSNGYYPLEHELPVLSTTIAFASRATNCSTPEDSTETPVSSQRDETEFAVSELFATVHSMPDSDSRKRRLVQKFNATNGGLTPAEKKSKKTPSRLKSIKRKMAFRQPDAKNIKTTTLYSPNSMSSIDAEFVLCCPLVETICSPFRKIADTPKSIRQRVKRSKTSKVSNISSTKDEVSIILDGQFYPNSESGSFVHCNEEFPEISSPGNTNEHMSFSDTPVSKDWLSEFVTIARMRRTRSLGDISNVF